MVFHVPDSVQKIRKNAMKRGKEIAFIILIYIVHCIYTNVVWWRSVFLTFCQQYSVIHFSSMYNEGLDSE